MTHLRKLTLDEIARRNYTESTTRAYIRVIADFARYFHRSPDQLGPDQVREYTAHPFRDLKLSDNSVNQRVGALRFFFRKVLKRPGDVDAPRSRRQNAECPPDWVSHHASANAPGAAVTGRSPPLVRRNRQAGVEKRVF